MADNMNKDYYYAELLAMMRTQGSKDNPPTLLLGKMLKHNKVQIDNLILEAEDFYVAENLTKGYKYPLEDPYVRDTRFGLAGTSTDTVSNAVRAKGLEKDDLVAIMRLQNTNKYVILAKVVQAE